MAMDLNHEYPRSPRVKLAGYVVAARVVDKCRAKIAGTLGPYKYRGRMDRYLFDFTGIQKGDLEAFVATGADDEAVAEWITKNAKERSEMEIILWNNQMRYLQINQLEAGIQVFLESYIEKHIPSGRVVNYWFDVYDIEEGRL